MLARLPARVRTPAVARAVASPSALLLAGAGASAAILAGAALPVVVAAGAGAWLARVLAAVPRRVAPDQPDPFSVGEPWRSFVQDAVQAQRRFRHTVNRMQPGPLRERLGEVGTRIDTAVRTCWRVAKRGDALDAALGQLDPASVRRELEACEEDDPAVASLRAQLDTAKRIARVSQDAHDRLRILNARLDEAVARAVELSVQAEEVGDLGPLAGDVDALVGEMESLRVALEETA
ncbi:MAG TPA: hypothetical protein VHF47_04310 [Acidimicrobiales bacterium]|nr:hypothetical protein [Acidimicrobiales bacterium]